MSGVYSAGFRTTQLPIASAGAIFHDEHQQREIPRHDLADHAERRIVGKLAVLQLRPAGVMQEVSRDQRHVDVARLADRLAVVQRFEHGEQPAVTLHHARQRIQMTRTSGAAQREPARLRGARRGDGRVDIGGIALGDLGQPLAARGRVRRKAFTR